MDIYLKIKQYCEKHSLTNVAFAKRAEISLETLRMLKIDPKYIPSLKILEKLALVLEIPVVTFLTPVTTKPNVFKVTWINNKTSIVFLLKDKETGILYIAISNIKAESKKMLYKFTQVQKLILSMEQLQYLI